MSHRLQSANGSFSLFLVLILCGRALKLPFSNQPQVPTLQNAADVPAKILWAPWLNTKWLGNLYEYRSGLFSDVMYSNSGLFREGALLFKQPAALEQVAMLYQRYDRFDKSSFGVSDATYFNFQGASAMRLGRYSIPLSNEIILTLKRPLQQSQIKEYLNTPNFLKWAADSAMQDKRIEQIKLTGLPFDDEDDDNDDSEKTWSFFKRAVWEIEYEQMFKDSSSVKSFRIHGMPLSVGEGCVTISPTKGLIVPMAIANSQAFVEGLTQSILDYSSSVIAAATPQVAVMIGGEKTIMSIFASEMVSRIALGNGFSDITTLDFAESDAR